jgi:hypothetical protein
MSEQGLLAMFEADRAALAARMAGRDSTGALRCMRGYLEGLADRCAAQDGPTPQGTRARARHVIEAVRSSFGALGAVQAPAAPESLSEPDPDRSPRSSPRFGGLLDKGVEFIADGWRTGDRDDPEPPEPEAVIAVRSEQLLDSLADALAAADRALHIEAPVEQPQSGPAHWSEDAALMDLFHDLVAARARNAPQELLLRVGLLEDELKLRHDIRTVSYDGTNEEFFEFLESPDPSDAHVWTRSPALVADTGLIRHGEVRCPARTQASASRPAFNSTKDTV